MRQYFSGECDVRTRGIHRRKRATGLSHIKKDPRRFRGSS